MILHTITTIHDNSHPFISCFIFQWCEHILYPETADVPQPQAPPMMPQMNNMGNVPNMQGMQGQLWDAFRAGAMWAQSQGGQMPPGQMMGMPGGYGQHSDNPNGKGGPMV